jgi:hypothetical protein
MGLFQIDHRWTQSANSIQNINKLTKPNNHSHRDAPGRDHAVPGLVVALKAGIHLHAAAVDVVNARQSLVVLRPDVPDLDGVSVRRGGEGIDAHFQAS